VEAHELLHNLGGVMSTAPHGTRAGHCWDEADTMCYADGGGFAMQQICSPQREYLLDCNNDDYFSTYPDPGSYLDGHWNAADSRFLIGGGDGSGGGTPGTPTVLGATIAVNNPAVPGLATQASVAPSLPTGRTITSVTWRSARADCSFSAPTQLQTDVTCAATAAAPTTVTATLVDSTGAARAVTSPLTFATGTARPVTLSIGAAGQSPAEGGNAAVCTSGTFAVTPQVLDSASGLPVKGLATAVTKQTAAMTAPASAGSPLTAVDGVATLNQAVTTATTYRARTALGKVYAAAGPASLVAVPAKCSTSLTASANASAVYYGDPVTVSGTLSATSSGVQVPAAGASVAIRLTTPAGKVFPLGTARTGSDGGYSLVVKPTASGTLSVALAATPAYAAATAAAGSVTVTLPGTLVSGAVDRTDVGYGSQVRVTGTLERDAGGVVTPLGSRSVGIYVTPSGGAAVKVGAGTTTANGSFSAPVTLKTTGTLSVAYAGAAGQPAASADVGPVVAGTWETTTTSRSSAATVVTGGSITLTGTVTKTYQGATVPAGAVRVSVYHQATGSATQTLVASSATSATGTYTVRAYPKASGTWTVKVLPVAGYAGSAATALTVTVN
jgi:hypothetical protein